MMQGLFYVAILSIATVLSHVDHDHNASHKKKVHRCVHDELDHDIRHQYVKYNDHPYDRYDDSGDANMDAEDILNVNSKRKLASDSDYEVIRIVPYYDRETITSSNSVLTTAQKQHIEALISASIRYFEQFVRVVPVDGPLFFDPCRVRYEATKTSDPFDWTLCTEDQLNQRCGHVDVPDDHTPDVWVYRSSSSSTADWSDSTLYRESGPGIVDADLVVYVSYNQSDDSCATGSTLAYAGTCIQDQYGRPVAGHINFCPSVVASEEWKMDLLTTLHELTHVLVMSQWLFKRFYRGDTPLVNDTDNTWIVTDKVTQIARSHFDCDSLIGVALENYGGSGTAGSHWEGKYLMHEYMIGVAFSSLDRVSAFTLALMEDSGWYQVDYDYAEPYVWGQNEGCRFLTDECIDTTTSASNYPQFWCDEDVTGCTADYAGVGDCLLYSNDAIPSKFKYYSDLLGGPELSDYCGFIEPTESTDDFEHICWDERGNTYDTRGYSNTYGVDSRCVQSKHDDGTQSGYCYRHKCGAFDSTAKQWGHVIIYAGQDTITCSREDALTVRSVASITQLSTIICPNIDAVCGTTSKPFECYWGEYNDELAECVCSVGYIGATCNTKDNVELVEEAQVATAPLQPDQSLSHAAVCLQGIDVDNARFLNGYYPLESTYDGVDAFYNASINANTGMWLFFKRYGSSWGLGSDLGTQRIFGVCDQYANLNVEPDIEECEEWYVYNQEEWVLAESAYAKYVTAEYLCVPDHAMCFVNKVWKQFVFVLLIASALL